MFRKSSFSIVPTVSRLIMLPSRFLISLSFAYTELADLVKLPISLAHMGAKEATSFICSASPKLIMLFAKDPNFTVFASNATVSALKVSLLQSPFSL